MVVKRISRRRKKSSSPRRKSRRKSKQKKRSRVRRRSKNKLEGGDNPFTRGIGVVKEKVAKKVKQDELDLISRYELYKSDGEGAWIDDISAVTFGNLSHSEKMITVRKWNKLQAGKKRKEDLVSFGQKFKKGVTDAGTSIKTKSAKDFNALLGKPYVLLVKNEEGGSTCVYKPQHHRSDYEYWYEQITNMIPVSDDVRKENVFLQARALEEAKALKEAR